MKSEKRIRNVVYIMFIIILGYFFMKYLLGIFLPLIISVTIAVVIRPVSIFIYRKTGISDKLSGAVLAVAFFILLFIGCYAVVRIFFAELFPIIKELPLLFEGKLSFLSGQTEKISQMLCEYAVKIAENAVIVTPWLAVSFGVTIAASVLFSSDYGNISHYIKTAFSERCYKAIKSVSSALRVTVGKMFYSYLIIFLITFVQLSVGLWLLRVPNAAGTAFLISFTDALPFVGTGTVLVPWAVIAFVQGKYPFSIGLVVLLLIISVVRNIAEPKIVGKNTGLHPVIAISAIYIGATVGGVGAAIFLPIFIASAWHISKERKFSYNTLSRNLK